MPAAIKERLGARSRARFRRAPLWPGASAPWQTGQRGRRLRQAGRAGGRPAAPLAHAGRCLAWRIPATRYMSERTRSRVYSTADARRGARDDACMGEECRHALSSQQREAQTQQPPHAACCSPVRARLSAAGAAACGMLTLMSRKGSAVAASWSQPWQATCEASSPPNTRCTSGACACRPHPQTDVIRASIAGQHRSRGASATPHIFA